MKNFLSSFILVICVFALTACSTGNAAIELPDLKIVGVKITSGRMPGDGFNYYEYLALVKVKNIGADLTSYDLYLNAGNDQENKKVFNKDDLFLLTNNEEIEIPYQILKANKDSRNFRFQIDSGNDEFSQQNGGLIEESNEKNNFYKVQIF